MRRSEWVDAAKGICILLVVLLHTSLWLRQAGMERIDAISAVNLATEDLRMPLFFAMAGLFAAKWIHAPWPAFLRSKAALLAWVFLLWQLPVIAYRLAAGWLLPGPTPTDLVTQLETMAWSPLRANAELWFLWALLLFFGVARLMRRWPAVVVVGVAAAVSVLWSGVLQPAGGGELNHLIGTGLYKAPVYFVFFIGAALGSPVIRDAVARGPRWAAVLVVAGWFVAFAWLDVAGQARDVPGVVFLSQLAGVIGGIALAVVLQRITPLAYLGRHTLEVYVSHTVIVVAIACVLYLGGVPLGAWTVIVVSLIAVLLGLLLGRVASGTWLLAAPEGLLRAFRALGRPAVQDRSAGLGSSAERGRSVEPGSPAELNGQRGRPARTAKTRSAGPRVRYAEHHPSAPRERA